MLILGAGQHVHHRSCKVLLRLCILTSEGQRTFIIPRKHFKIWKQMCNISLKKITEPFCFSILILTVVTLVMLLIILACWFETLLLWFIRDLWGRQLEPGTVFFSNSLLDWHLLFMGCHQCEASNGGNDCDKASSTNRKTWLETASSRSKNTIPSFVLWNL